MSLVVPPGGLVAPGMADAELVEQAARSGPGCARMRWRVAFRAPPGADAGTPFHGYATTEIAPAASRGCPAVGYVHLDPGVDQAQGFAALAMLARVRAGRVRLGCIDHTSSDLCGSDRATRRVLAALSPWAVSRDAGDMRVWLGTPGQVVTEVRFDPEAPDRAQVTRSVPAPS